MSWTTRRRWSFQDLPRDIPHFLDPQSTTRRAHLFDPHGFNINLLSAALEQAEPDECQSLCVSLRSYAWIREVELSLLESTVMFARLVVPYSALKAAFGQIRYLDRQSLGCYLFKLSGIKREPFEIKKIVQGDKFYERIMRYQGKKTSELWARRSIFCYKGSRLLLTEVFLPCYSQIMRGPFPCN